MADYDRRRGIPASGFLFYMQECSIHDKFRKAVGCYFSGRVAESVKALRGLLVKSPRYDEARFKLAEIYLATKKTDLALKELLQLVNYVPDSYRARRQLADLFYS